MAGLGSRFSDAGYLLPKALIPVSGKPMIAREIEGMPPADKWIFIVRQEHIDQYQIDQLIKNTVPNAIVIPIDYTTEGQASTWMLAMPHLDQDEELFVAACDNSYVYNEAKFAALKNDPPIDAIIWTFTKNERLSATPKSWGWVKLETDGQTISDMSVKVPVSDDPFNDHAVVATFWFRHASDFAAAYELMVKENYRVNNEFYADSLPIFYKKRGQKSVIFDVDLSVRWDKPADLYQYELAEYQYRAGKQSDPLWQKYFANLK